MLGPETQGPTLMQNHENFYNDAVILITAMYFITTMSAGPLGQGPTPNVTPLIFLQGPSTPNRNHVLSYKLSNQKVVGLGPNPNATPWIFLQRPSTPNHNHVLSYNHGC